MGFKNLSQLTSHIAKIEGKKTEVAVGNVREILAILSDLIHENDEWAGKDGGITFFESGSIAELLAKNGSRRNARRRAK